MTCVGGVMLGGYLSWHYRVSRVCHDWIDGTQIMTYPLLMQAVQPIAAAAIISPGLDWMYRYQSLRRLHVRRRSQCPDLPSL
jgi:hypothetical protein